MCVGGGNVQLTPPPAPPPGIVTVTAAPTFVAATPSPTKSKEETAEVISDPSSLIGIEAAEAAPLTITC